MKNKDVHVELQVQFTRSEIWHEMLIYLNNRICKPRFSYNFQKKKRNSNVHRKWKSKLSTTETFLHWSQRKHLFYHKSLLGQQIKMEITSASLANKWKWNWSYFQLVIWLNTGHKLSSTNIILNRWCYRLMPLMIDDFSSTSPHQKRHQRYFSTSTDGQLPNDHNNVPKQFKTRPTRIVTLTGFLLRQSRVLTFPTPIHPFRYTMVCS